MIMKNLRNIIVISLGIIKFYSCSPEAKVQNEDKAIKVEVYSPDKATNEGFYLSGQITAKQTATISTRIMGYVRKIYVKPGDRVNAGQLLVSISSDDISAKKAQAQAMVIEAEAAAKNTQRDFERFKRLREQNSVSDKELENVELQNTSINARLQVARQSLNEVNAMLAYTNIQAPFSGIVSQKMIDEGSMANPGMPLLVIEQGGDLQVVASVSETYIQYVKVGDKADIELKSISRSLQGIITVLSPSAYGTGGQYSVKISIDDTNKKDIQSGMFANIFIPNNSASGIPSKLTLDITSIIYRDQLTGVYVVNEENQASLRWIKLGKETGNQVEVLSGLKPNDKIILKADGKLYNGKKVNISQI